MDETADLPQRTSRSRMGMERGGVLCVAGGMAAGVGALIASSCCLIPLAFASLGAGAGVFSVLSRLAPWRVPLIALAVAALVSAWALNRRQARVCCAGVESGSIRRRIGVIQMLSFATALIVLAALVWPRLEPVLLRSLSVR
ncbi:MULTISPECIES: hypothetical protein [Acetobacteraceae]|jgi:mercuric ion transport protein|uniref:Mercuric ion transport protein n=10 Tax=Acetobacteraceae TaxID=433 RepID=A0A839UZY3_9PROT|nr:MULTISPECIES: hypothetical protein [Acetobacteraceae]MBB3173690.1 mercuric ion transport protein [Endobacter medicaginis]MCX5475026.1 hypothetical protein [Endobacter medicaginis]MDF3624654.1 hypothetical protein [Brytella acorum]TCS29576.1 mercuric ion transport protein [Acidomonas methanolica]TCS31900.1 mercuric ion transport protein [Acetobacter aceti NBRC 14818]